MEEPAEGSAAYMARETAEEIVAKMSLGMAAPLAGRAAAKKAPGTAAVPARWESAKVAPEIAAAFPEAVVDAERAPAAGRRVARTVPAEATARVAEIVQG